MATISEALAAAHENHQAGRLAVAEQIYLEVLKALPDHAEILYRLGTIKQQAGEPGAAADYISRAIGGAPNSALFHNSLGQCHLALQNRDAALACWRRATELQPGFIEPRICLEVALRGQAAIAASPFALEHTKTVLHVGCGGQDPLRLHAAFRAKPWREVRLDIDPDVRPDIVASITAMTPVAGNSVDAVWSSHNLEHLFAHEVSLALHEFLRVLKAGGTALITMPDVQEVARHVAEGRLEEPLYVSPAGPIAAIDVLYGFRGSISQGNHFMAHRTGFTAASLSRKLQEAGFVDVNVEADRPAFALWAVASKPG